MYGLGVASGVGITLGEYLLGQLMVSSAQVTAHYVNEYADVEADYLVDNRTFFSGGSGVLVEGHVTPQVALKAAWASTAVALGSAVAVWQISPAAALLGCFALIVSWAYSMPPVRLLNTGWGELVTSIVVTVVVPLIGLSVTRSSATSELSWVVAVLLPVHVAMMLVFESPDAITDRRAGKTVLAVRFGEPRTLVLIFALYLLSGSVAWLARPAALEVGSSLPVTSIAATTVGMIFYSVRRRSFGWATTLAVGLFTFLGAISLFYLAAT
jgi:1,4-dihydroxy-2-naphthoate octaprenyltransferase